MFYLHLNENPVCYSEIMVYVIHVHVNVLCTLIFLPLQTMPTDMRALQDFDESDKLKIHANDVITIIEGRSRDRVVLQSKSSR